MPKTLQTYCKTFIAGLALLTGTVSSAQEEATEDAKFLQSYVGVGYSYFDVIKGYGPGGIEVVADQNIKWLNLNVRYGYAVFNFRNSDTELVHSRRQSRYHQIGGSLGVNFRLGSRKKFSLEMNVGFNKHYWDYHLWDYTNKLSGYSEFFECSNNCKESITPFLWQYNSGFTELYKYDFNLSFGVRYEFSKWLIPYLSVHASRYVGEGYQFGQGTFAEFYRYGMGFSIGTKIQLY